MSCKVGIYEKDEEESKDDRQYHLKIEVKKLQPTLLAPYTAVKDAVI